ncbi:MAG: hypothetical protein ACRCTJ_06465, partial [Brevinema sp.]
MRKTINNFLSKIIFFFFLIYIVCLGILNISVALNKDHLERFLAEKLYAESVTFNNISNLPFVFVSFSDITIIVDDKLEFSVQGIYFYYRFWKFFTKEFEQILGDLRIEQIKFIGYTTSIKDYIQLLQLKYGNINLSIEKTNTSSKKSIDFHLENMNLSINIKQVEIIVRMMTEFRHTFAMNNTIVQLKNNNVNFGAKINLQSVWSNLVFIGSSTFNIKGSSNLTDLEGDAYINFYDLNLAGLPLVDKLVTMKLSVKSNQITPTFINRSKQKILIDTAPNDFQLFIDKTFAINYKDYEEYEMLDYAFAQGNWNFKFDLQQSDFWFLHTTLKSRQHPNYGLDLRIEPINK